MPDTLTAQTPKTDIAQPGAAQPGEPKPADLTIDPPKVVQTKAQPTAALHLVVPREEIRSVMGPSIAEVLAALKSQGIAPTGPFFTHHHRPPNETFDFEICFPVASPISPSGRVKPSEWPAMEVARTIHHGPYEGLGAAWGEFHAWIAGNGLKPATDLWERYLVGPESGPDSSTWKTELNCPLQP